AMVSRPTFDPNKFAVRIKSSDWKEIADNPDHPLINRDNTVDQRMVRIVRNFPNKFAVRIKSSDWKEIADNPDHPLINRVIQAQQAPGSTFKPFVALAGLETGS